MGHYECKHGNHMAYCQECKEEREGSAVCFSDGLCVELIKEDNKVDKQEWICLECRATGIYADLRSRRDSGVDSHCGIEVKNIEDVECEGCKYENDCERDYRADGCYT